VKENSHIARVRKEVKAEFRMAKDKADEEAGTLASIQDRVSASRREMVHQAEECARLRQEMNELEFRKSRIEETHKTNLGLLNESISGTRDMLAKERAERQKMQSEQLEVSSAKAAMKREHNEELARTTQRIDGAVQNHEKLTHKLSNT
jgi:chromosome segregation ATPase